MEFLLILGLLALGVRFAQVSEQRERVNLLADQLRPYGIEQHMARLIEGYLRAASEPDSDRAGPVWQTLEPVESALERDMGQLTESIRKVWGESMRVSRLPVHVPQVTRFFPGVGFDFRALVSLHAQGLAAALRNPDGLGYRDRAFRVTAELMLFQHSCHWYCRSKTVADARLLLAHQTAYAQVLAAVTPQTRAAYQALIRPRSGPPPS